MNQTEQNACLRQLIELQYELYAYVSALSGDAGDAKDVLQNANLQPTPFLKGF